ncbi:MAG: ribonuclease Z [Myxococcales bacterium]|nr:ribonuclease Z [Myxococcales bacterium]
MRLTVLGSGTTVPDPDRGPCGLLLQVDGHAWLIDGGSGTVQRCARAGVDPRTLDGGVYSHHHPDHCADLVPLLFAMRVGPPQRSRPYPIWAGQGFAQYFERLRAAHGTWIDPGGGVPITELSLDEEASAALAPGVTLRTRPANHSASALHLRFEAHGRAVVFSGDTGPSDGLVQLARGADLLVCECAGPDDAPLEGHLTPSQVAAIAAAARPEELWLTHFYPMVDPQRAVATVAETGVPVRRARDLDSLELPRLTPTRS